MRRWIKLALDIIIGAVVPIYLLENMSEVWGTVATYLVAALIPVGYVLVDTAVITRRFNVITSFGAAGALLRGALAFWFVDGPLFALKDSAGFILNVIVFGGTLALGRPVMRFFMAQALGPDTPEKTAALDDALAADRLTRAAKLATAVIACEGLITGIVNFGLNLAIVVAPFGDPAFNRQVAQVNAITRIAFALTSSAAYGFGFYLMYRALFATLPAEPGKAQEDSDLWELILLRFRSQPAQATGLSPAAD